MRRSETRTVCPEQHSLPTRTTAHSGTTRTDGTGKGAKRRGCRPADLFLVKLFFRFF